MARARGNPERSTLKDTGGLASVVAETDSPAGCAEEVMDTVPLVMRFMRAEVRRHEKTASSVTQIRVLAFLKRNPGASLSGVADHLCVTRATASATIERMVRRGLVDRSDNPNERRCIVLTATAAGEEHYRRARRVAQAAVAGKLASLPA